MKPKIFVGSSVEGLAIAKAIQLNLEHYAYTEIWTQADFTLSTTTLDSLIKIANNSDFAIFVFTPDDALVIRKNDVKAVRDNVLFELGLFMGAISRDKVYFIKARGVDLHLPTDLWGITAGEYDEGNPKLAAAVGPFCTQVENLVKELYTYEFPDAGRHGRNLLSINTTSIETGKKYCFAAKIPKNARLVVTIEQPNYVKNGDRTHLIAFELGTNKGFAIFERDEAGTILSIDLDEREGEYPVWIKPENCIIIKVYLNESKEPLLTKQFGIAI